MIEQYKKEMAQVHAPEMLVKITREKMEQEKVRLLKDGKRNRNTIRLCRGKNEYRMKQ